MAQIETDHILMYTTGEVFSGRQSGGTKRFVELLKYLTPKGAELCSRDDEDTCRRMGVIQSFKMRKPSGLLAKITPLPEIGLFISNYKSLKKIKETGYRQVISFDVPPTIGLCLIGIKHIQLLIRKDLIGYELANTKKPNIKSNMRIMIMRLCESICIRKAEKIIVQCEYDKNELIKRHGRLSEMIEEKTRIQINNNNPSWIVEQSKLPCAELEHSSYIIGFVGNFDNDRKGNLLFLSVAKRILDEGYDVVFEVVGGGKNFEKVREQYNEYSRIHFWGHQKNSIQVSKACDLIIVPSKADSCPNTVMEPMYNDVLVIGSKSGGIPEILCNDEALFNLDENELYKKVVQIISSSDYRNKLMEYQTARKKELMFDWAERISIILNCPQ